MIASSDCGIVGIRGVWRLWGLCRRLCVWADGFCGRVRARCGPGRGVVAKRIRHLIWDLRWCWYPAPGRRSPCWCCRSRRDSVAGNAT